MHGQPPPQPPPSTTHVSDFARDFYATISVPPGGFSDVSGARASSGGGGGGRNPPPPPHPSQAAAAASPTPPTPPSQVTPSSATATCSSPAHHECSKSRLRMRRIPGMGRARVRADPRTRRCHSSARCPASAPRRPSPSPGAQYGYGAPPNGPAIYNASNVNGYNAPNAHAYTTPPPVNAYPPPSPRISYPQVTRASVARRCGGSGTLSFLIFETIGCSVCRGVGRVYG
ncbi:hypothetical protein C8R44DRAFT_817849 [Mycena epipterygia]|nr:hypothetical protein C8R44DRAFT_817849 [Mycena epipterygia]